MDARILVIGSSNIDFVLKTSYVPAAGETLVTDGSYGFVPGGKGANAAVAARIAAGEEGLPSWAVNRSFAHALATMHTATGFCRSFPKAASTGVL